MKRILWPLMVMLVAAPVMARELPNLAPSSPPPQAPVPAPAAETPVTHSSEAGPLTHDRRGIVAGIGVGVGEQLLYYSTMNRQNTVPMVDLKLGYGITDKILVLFNPNLIFYRNDGFSIYTFQFPVAAQFYVFKDLYLRPGVGVSFSTRSYDAFMRAQYITGKITVGANMAVGYEFRLAKGRIGLSPELVYHYDRIPSGFNVVQSNTIGLQVSLLSYFKVQ